MKKVLVSALLLAGLTVGMSSLTEAAPSAKARRHGVDCAAESRKGGRTNAHGQRTAFSRCVTAAAKG